MIGCDYNVSSIRVLGKISSVWVFSFVPFWISISWNHPGARIWLSAQLIFTQVLVCVKRIIYICGFISDRCLSSFLLNFEFMNRISLELCRRSCLNIYWFDSSNHYLTRNYAVNGRYYISFISICLNTLFGNMMNQCCFSRNLLMLYFFRILEWICNYFYMIKIQNWALFLDRVIYILTLWVYLCLRIYPLISTGRLSCSQFYELLVLGSPWPSQKVHLTRQWSKFTVHHQIIVGSLCLC